MTAPDRPVLRYYGGKWRLAPWILRHFPPHEVYVEPFGGSAAVLLQKPESPLEVWNDLGLEVYNFFAVLRDEALCARLVRALEFTPWHREEFERCYAGLGEPQDDPVERARRFFVVSWQGVGAPPSWRHVLHARYHDVPSHTWSFDHLLAASRRLRRVQLEHRDALEVMGRYDSPDTLFYLDPPIWWGRGPSGCAMRWTAWTRSGTGGSSRPPSPCGGWSSSPATPTPSTRRSWKSEAGSG